MFRNFKINSLIKIQIILVLEPLIYLKLFYHSILPEQNLKLLLNSIYKKNVNTQKGFPTCFEVIIFLSFILGEINILIPDFNLSLIDDTVNFFILKCKWFGRNRIIYYK